MTSAPGLDAVPSRLEARHLQKSYGSRKVVKDVSLSVAKGEVVGLLGPNGAGKTTSFYMIVGLVRADGGQILIDGQDVTRMPIHKRARMGLSYLPQEASIFRKLTVADNVRAILELHTDDHGRSLSRGDIEKRLDALLLDLRVDHLRDSPAVALSGGERRRDRPDQRPEHHRRGHRILVDDPLADGLGHRRRPAELVGRLQHQHREAFPGGRVRPCQGTAGPGDDHIDGLLDYRFVRLGCLR